VGVCFYMSAEQTAMPVFDAAVSIVTDNVDGMQLYISVLGWIPSIRWLSHTLTGRWWWTDWNSTRTRPNSCVSAIDVRKWVSLRFELPLRIYFFQNKTYSQYLRHRPQTVMSMFLLLPCFRWIKICMFYIVKCAMLFLDPECRSQKATLVVFLLVVVISSLKIPKAFLTRSDAQWNYAYTFPLIFPTDLPSQIFSWRNAIISVIKVQFYVTDLKLDIEPSLNVQLHHSGLLQHDARWSVVMNIYAQVGLTVGL